MSSKFEPTECEHADRLSTRFHYSALMFSALIRGHHFNGWRDGSPHCAPEEAQGLLKGHKLIMQHKRKKRPPLGDPSEIRSGVFLNQAAVAGSGVAADTRLSRNSASALHLKFIGVDPFDNHTRNAQSPSGDFVQLLESDAGLSFPAAGARFSNPVCLHT